MSGRDDVVLEAIRGLSDKLGSLDEKMSSFEEKLGSLDAKLGSLDAKVGSLDTKVGSLDDKLRSFDLRLVELEHGQAMTQSDIEKTRGDILTRMERFENQITLFREDVIVAVGASTTVNTKIDSNRAVLDEMTKIVLTMQQQLLRLRTRVDELEKGREE